MENRFIQLGEYLIRGESIIGLRKYNCTGACINGDYLIEVLLNGRESELLYFEEEKKRDSEFLKLVSKLKE